MDKLYLEFDKDGFLTLHIEGDIQKFIKTIQNKDGKLFFGFEKKLIENRKEIEKLYEDIYLIPRVDTINSKKNERNESINEEKYEVCDLPVDITFDGKNFYKFVPLEWVYKEKNYFVCKNTSYNRSTIENLFNQEKLYREKSTLNDYLNEKILPKLFAVKNVDRKMTYEANCKMFRGTLEDIILPKQVRKIDIKYSNDKIILEKPITLIKITIPESVKMLNCAYEDASLEKDFLYDIYFPNKVDDMGRLLHLRHGKINSIIFDENFKSECYSDGVFFSPLNCVNELQIPCNKFLLPNILNLSVGSHFRYIFDKNSKLILSYKDEEELLEFIKEISLIDKKLNILNKKVMHIKSQVNLKVNSMVEFNYCHKRFYSIYNFNKEASLSDIDITLCGPELSLKMQNKVKRILHNDNVTFSFGGSVSNKIINDENGDNKKESVKEKVNETTLLANDIIEEIKSINYFGLDKEKVNGKLKSIIDKYNEDLDNLKVSNKGLTLHSNEGLYTNLLLKLNELKDSLYQKFEKNLVVYDMLDEENILISILNGEEVIINNSLESDFYLLSKNILPFVEKKITDDLRNYLESEKQKLENYLLTGENKPYDDMDKFILNIRTYLNITLLSIRNYLNKEEILEVIRDYTNMQMQINYKEPIKNYLSILLQEIDKTKKEILSIDKTADIDDILNMLNINYQALESMEIIAHLTNIFNKLYRFYLNVKYERDLDLKMESYKIKI